MITALIGSNGTIGSSILNNMSFTYVYNSDNIKQFKDHKFDLVVCAAPSGNRLTANKNPEHDLASIEKLIDALGGTSIKKLVLISTVDTVAYPNSSYGENRLKLENFVKINNDDYHILRLSTLIGKSIKKNVLYDLKHNLFIDKINPDSVVQWCPLDTLHTDIKYVINNNIKEINLVSEPIANKNIIAEFFNVKIDAKSNPTHYDIQPYRYTKQDIYTAIQNYLQ